VLEVFLEPTCPYSVLAFDKLEPLLAEVGEDRMSLKIRLHPQPWHMFSGLIVRSILAASLLEGGKEDAKRVLEVVGEHRAEFEFEAHCRGPNMDVTPRELLARLERYSGLPLSTAFEAPEVGVAFKWHVKYARQNGVHFSPTFMIDGLLQSDMSSGDEVASWARKLGG
jgi:hypothetical protein